ncbi:MAG TPA: hypothetical protein VGG14_16590 [Candidatus Sulfotelmatobacter sp.]|jgi:hypothetical protein
MTTNDALVQEVNYLIECCLASENRPNTARRLLAASNLIRSQWELVSMLGDRNESKKLLGLMGRLVLRAGELLGDSSQEHQWLKELEEEAAGMKAAAATGGM